MNNLGSFDEATLILFSEMVAGRDGFDFSEGETYDFTRCVRPNGTAYGTRGKCKSGTEEAKAAPTVAPSAPKRARPTSSERAAKAKGTGDSVKSARETLKKIQAVVKTVLKETKKDNSKEARQRRADAQRALERAEKMVERAEKQHLRESDKFHAARRREEMAKMSPERRKQERALDKEMKLRG